MKKQYFYWSILVAMALVVLWFERQAAEEPQSTSSDYVLAVSWQPAFCERRPNKRECRSQRVSRYDASNFSLHGLWPQPRNNVYCGITDSTIQTDKSGNWRQLRRLELSKETRQSLETIMPGYASFLHRHEWVKHGTCANGWTAETYYQVSLDLMKELNASSLRDLFASNISQRVTRREIEAAFEKDFGAGTGDHISVDCRRDGQRQLITELKISLVPGADGKLTMGIGKSVSPGCDNGIVDRVGLQ